MESLGYNILVTDNRGMKSDGIHGGTTPDVHEVPLNPIHKSKIGLGNSIEILCSQLKIVSTI